LATLLSVAQWPHVAIESLDPGAISAGILTAFPVPTDG